MKKLLLSLSSLVIILGSASAVSACGFQEPHNVILELSNNIAKPASPILRAYRAIVDAYNHDRPNNKRQIEVRETPANNIDNEIATGQPVPSLYVAYGDTSAKYETILSQIDEGDKIVDTAQVVNWDQTYVNSIDPGSEPQIAFIKDKGFGNNATAGNELTGGKPLDEITQVDPASVKDHFRPLKDSFPREGSNNNKMYVVPTAKSGFAGVMNTRLLNELVRLVTGLNLANQVPEASIRPDGHFFADGGVDWSRFSDQPLNQLTGDWKLPVSNNVDQSQTITQLLTSWFSAVTTVGQIQSLMQDLSKLEVILMAYMRLVDTSTNRGYFKSSFSMAIDDIAGLIYTMQANLGLSEDQFYSWTNQELYKLYLYDDRHQNAKSIAQVIEFFKWADDLRKLDPDATNLPDHGYGGVTAKLSTGQYYSDFWIKEGMLAYFGSTAGAKYWVGKNGTGVSAEDIQLLSPPVYQPTGASFMAQQGPGMAMFKSNIQEKNEIAIDFVNYFLKAENNTEFAFAAGYIPSNYYAYYKDYQPEGGIPRADNYGPYYDVLAYEASLPSDEPYPWKIPGAKVVKKIADGILANQTQLWTQIPSPFGDAMRFQVLVPWFESNFKTFQNHYLNFAQFWEDLQNDNSMASVNRVVQSLFPVEGSYEIIGSGK